MAFGGMFMTYNPQADAATAALANKQDIGSRTVTAAATITNADTTIIFNSASAIATQTLPAANSVTVDKKFQLTNINTGLVTITSSLSGQTNRTLAQYAGYTIYSDGTAWWIA